MFKIKFFHLVDNLNILYSFAFNQNFMKKFYEKIYEKNKKLC
jgi:hypothetical protein